MKHLLSLITFLSFFSFACLDRYAIPENINTNTGGTFGAGDTTYLQLNPVWDSSYGLTNPVEISIAQDGRIFVADSGANSILVFDQNGSAPSGFDQLKNLSLDDGTSIAPTDVDIDQKMNIFFINGTQQIFVWNQYWNSVGINKVSENGTFTHITSSIDTTVAVNSSNWFSLFYNPLWELTDLTFTQDQDLIDSLLSHHVFYDGRDEKNVLKDIHYNSTHLSKFTGLTAPSDTENHIFVVDTIGHGLNSKDRILQIDFQHSHLLELVNGEYVWSFSGKFGATVLGPGSGSEFVNDPLSLDVDYLGNLYYTQTGEEFPIHMIIPDYSGDYASYSSGFNPALDDIMNPNMVNHPADIAVDENRNIYVVDSDSSHVKVFDSNGKFFKKAGYASKIDTISLLKNPVALTVDNRGIIYVCDKSEGSIFRFKLSNTLDEDIQPTD
ncbi:hypothetical protein OAR31_04955 [Candidatus Marinimicrobia bacterium]|nr:hypothetical protein [Candidatus Neomarinimicrobiota bacterium]